MKVNEAADGVTQVVLDGRFDIAGAQEVDARFGELAGTAKTLVIDLSKVSFLASLGVRTLMVTAKTMIRRGADIAVAGADENVEKVLRSTGFDEIVGSLSGLRLGRRGVDEPARAVREREGSSEPQLVARVPRHGRGRRRGGGLVEEPIRRPGPRRGHGVRHKPLRRGAVPQRVKHGQANRRPSPSGSNPTACARVRRRRRAVRSHRAPAKRLSGPADGFRDRRLRRGARAEVLPPHDLSSRRRANRLVLEFDAGPSQAGTQAHSRRMIDSRRCAPPSGRPARFATSPKTTSRI